MACRLSESSIAGRSTLSHSSLVTRPRATDALKPEEIDVPRAERQLEHGQQMWKEAGESEDAYTDALRVISEAEAKIASAHHKN